MIPHFTLNRGKQEYLIIRMGDEFHIIDLNEAMTKEKRLAILESGCTPAQMQEMGLSGTTIPKADIKALTVTGCGFQDDVIFWLHGKKLAYWLPQAYDQHEMDDFFRGIPRKQYKTRRKLRSGNGRDWRTREQNPDLFPKLCWLGMGWYLACIGVVAAFFVTDISMELWGWAVIAVSLAAVVLDMLLPQYFTILRQSKRERLRAPTHAINLTFGLFALLAVFTLACRARYHIVHLLTVLPIALALTLAMGAVLFLFCREFSEDVTAGVFAMLLVLIFNSFAFVPHFNHILGPELEKQTCTIVDQHQTSSRWTGATYYCTVELADGRELDVIVGLPEYESYAPGDTMQLQVGTGFFGIDYAIDG